LPLDLWIYQELIWQLRPQIVVELGTWAGGTANFLADIMDIYNADETCRVLTVDLLDTDSVSPYIVDYVGDAPSRLRIRPPHHRIEYVRGDTLSEAVVQHVRAAVAGKSPVLIIADSDHSFEHTYQELITYHELVTPGSHFIVEDTDCPGPRQAVDAFLSANRNFHLDTQCEKFYWLWHTKRAGNPVGIDLDPVNPSGALAVLAGKRQEVVFGVLVSFVPAFRWLAGRASARYGRSRTYPGAPHRSDGVVFRVWPSLTTGA
jgi:cephalosporin hydroxylase